MRKFLSLPTVLLLIIFSVQICKASTLIFKAQKEISSEQWVELGAFDTAKYKQIRITVTSTDTKNIDLVKIVGVETDSVFTLSSGEFKGSYNQLIDTPPTRIKVSVTGSGTFRLYVYAS